MAIQPPRPKLNAAERKIIRLLAEILLEDLNINTLSTNMPDDHLLLSERAANDLLILIEKLIENKEFMEKISFSDEVGFKKNDSYSWRTVYLDRSRQSKVMAVSRWAELRFRVRSMPFEYFIKMESTLFHELGIGERLRGLLFRFLSTVRPEVDRERRASQGLAAAGATLRGTASELKKPHLKFGGLSVDKKAIGGLLFIVSNASVLFTTRDWTAAGVISVMSGSLMDTLTNKDLRP